jgi:hypothetical protein
MVIEHESWVNLARRRSSIVGVKRARTYSVVR